MVNVRALMVAAACLVPVHADADPAKAWAAAKAHAPGNAAIVGGVNLSELGKSSLVKMLIPLAAPVIKKSIDQLQRVCGVDAWKTIEAVAWAVDAKLEDGALFIAVKDLDQAKLNACAEGVAKEGGDKSATVTATAQGSITELSAGNHKYYLMWIGKDVISVPLEISDKAQLERWTPKKGTLAKSKVGKLAAKVDTKATVWAASTLERDLEGAKIKAAYGSMVLRGGNLNADMRIAFGDAASAKATTDKLNTELAGKTEMKDLLGKLSLTAAKEEMVVKARLTEAELMQAAGSVIGGP